MSLKRGAVPIILLDGARIVSLMIERDLGLRRVPLNTFELVANELMSDQTAD